jgi:hypothetical protein
MLQAEVELLAQKGDELTADLGSCEGKAEGVIGTARHHTLAAQPAEERVFDRVRVPVGSTEGKENPNPLLRVSVELPHILIDGVVDSSAAAFPIGGLRGYEQIRKELRRNALNDRSSIGKSGKPVLQQ